MRKFCIALVMACVPSISFADISYYLCNKNGIQARMVVAKDKKNNMAIIHSGLIAKDACELVYSSTGNSEYAEIELKLDQAPPYGVPWIKSGDNVNF